MSTILPLIRAVLSASTPVTAVVAARIHPVELPQAPTLPAIVLTPVQTTDERTLQGHARYPVSDVVVDVCAATFAAADDLAETVKDALQNYRGGPIDDIASTSLDITDRGQAGDIWRRRLGFSTRWRQT
jgi:hypothetical protein